MRGVPSRSPAEGSVAPLVWCLPHRVVAPRQEPKIPRSYTRIFRLDGTLVAAGLAGGSGERLAATVGSYADFVGRMR